MAWTRIAPHINGATDGRFKRGEPLESDGLRLACAACRGFAAYWLAANDTGAFGESMNSLPKFIATTLHGLHRTTPSAKAKASQRGRREAP